MSDVQIGDRIYSNSYAEQIYGPGVRVHVRYCRICSDVGWVNGKPCPCALNWSNPPWRFSPLYLTDEEARQWAASGTSVPFPDVSPPGEAK